MHVIQLFRNRSRGRHKRLDIPLPCRSRNQPRKWLQKINKQKCLTHSLSFSLSLNQTLTQFHTPKLPFSLSHNFRFEFQFLLLQPNLERFQSSTMLLHHHHPLLYDSIATKASLITSVMSNNASRSCIGPSHVSEMRSIILFMHLIFFFLHVDCVYVFLRIMRVNSKFVRSFDFIYE